MDFPEFTEYTDEQLTELLSLVSRERDRRLLMESAEERIDSILVDVKQAQGFQDGDEWVEPTGAHDAYPAGTKVHHAGNYWHTALTANVWEPGVSSWHLCSSPGDGPPEWLQPSGYTDSYNTGDQVTYDGTVWVSDVDQNVWAPGVHGWTEV